MRLHLSRECLPRMAEFRLTPAAERDLEMIWTHTRQQWGIEQAHRYIDILTTVFAELAQSPQTAPIWIAAEQTALDLGGR